MSNSITIGIDLGTTNSCVAVYRGCIETIVNDQGHPITPSIVAFTANGRIIGEGAKIHAQLNPKEVVFCVKRLIGRNFDDQHVKDDIKLFPFEVSARRNQPIIKVPFNGEIGEFSPEEISAMVLSKMKQIAEDCLGVNKVKNAVITVPAYFNDAQRQATKDAGEIAGLNVLRIINEPTAAALAYGLQEQSSKREKTVLVFDFGGGTLDVTILTIDKGVIEVKSTSGDTHLGGEDFDNLLVKHIANEFKIKHGKDPLLNKRALNRLKAECEKQKKALSANSQAVLEIDNFLDGQHLRFPISRAKFENICSELFKSILYPVKKALSDASLNASQIDEVILVGGSTRIPKVQRILSDHFNRTIRVSDIINPDEAVAHGAAIQGAIMNGESGPTEDLVLLDVIPHTLGIKTKDGKMAKLIARNSPIPHKATRVFTTYVDNQTSVEIAVLEGESEFIAENRLLGSFKLQDIPPLPAGTPQIEVTVMVDENGIVKVSAVEKISGNKQVKIVTDKNGLTESEKSQITARQKEVEKIEQKRRELDAAVHTLKNRMNEIVNETSKEPAVSRLTFDEKSKIMQAVESSKAFLESRNIEEVTRQHKLLNLICDPIFSRIDDEMDFSYNSGGLVIEEIDDDDELSS